MPLTLSRRKGESIVIGDDVHVTVEEIRGDKVRLSIDAPRDVPVDRSEIRASKLADLERSGKWLED